MTERSAPPRAALARRRLFSVAAAAVILAVLAGVYGIARSAKQSGGRRLRRSGRDRRPARAAGARRSRRARCRPGAIPRSRSRLQGCRRPRADAEGLARPHRPSQPLGDLVRALPQGDAGARRARAGARRAEVRGGRRQYRHPRSRQAASVSQEVDVKHLAYYSDPSAKVFQELKSAGKAFGMPTTLIVDPAAARSAPWPDPPSGQAPTA